VQRERLTQLVGPATEHWDAMHCRLGDQGVDERGLADARFAR